MRTVYAVDLFAGAGGTSTGLALACKQLSRKIDLTAINHWQKAIETHSLNHPWAKHLLSNIEAVDPRTAVPGGRVNILIAAPECTHFSCAAGGRPKLDQKRSSAWQILRWLELLEIDSLLVENVPEFASWGALDKKGYPIKSEKGRIFDAWTESIRAFGYRIEFRILNAADYGAATSRKRLFIMGKRGKGKITWPEPSFSRDGSLSLSGAIRPKWKSARGIIDWSLKGESIFTRKRDLSPNTIRRIIAGLKKFGGDQLQPFIILMEHGGGLHDISNPLPTITTAKGGSMALAEPFLMSQGSGGAPRSVDDPLFTNVSAGGGSIVEPFILPPEGIHRGNTPKSLEEPIGALTQRGGGHLVQAHIIVQNGQSIGSSLDCPVPSMTTNNKLGLIESCLLPYNGTSVAQSIDEPLPTITTRDRFGLVQPEINGQRLDIRFRMLQPHELSAAMGFPRGYTFKGTKTDIVKQIGNAVVVQVSKALCLSLLR